MAPARTAAPRPLRNPTAPRIRRTLTPAASSDLGLAHDGKYLSLEYGPVTVAGAEHEDAEDVEFDRCRFTKTTLAGVRLTGARFADVAFDGCDLANTKLFKSHMFSASLANCRMTGMQMTEGGMRDVVVDGCRADLAAFRFARLRDVVFTGCNLSEANFQSAELTNVRFEGCKLIAAQFSNATMRQVVFAGGNDLAGISGVQSLGGAVVSSADAPGLLGALASALGITIED
jgi:uncharacterized protein YjbI with pentapeptide repeats